MNEFLKQLSEIVSKENIYLQEPMKKHTTFRIGGDADVFVTPDISLIPEVIRLAKEHQIPVTVIGNGSNLLVGDGGIRGQELWMIRQIKDWLYRKHFWQSMPF